MKYVIIIPDGAADHPLKELENRTPFEAADIPNLDKLAKSGRQGTVNTTPQGFPCGSDVCSMCLLGYDPTVYHKGRAPLEAAALGIDLHPDDWIFRVNFVTVLDGNMQDHSAGAITSDEGVRLLEDFANAVEVDELTLFPGVSYRNILVDTSGRPSEEQVSDEAADDEPADEVAPRDWSQLRTTPPHDIPGEPISKYLPTGGPNAQLLRDLIDTSAELFAEHEINQTRKELGELPATHVWPWGQGQMPIMPSFFERFGLRGAMITAVDLLAGIARFMDWDRLDVPGQTSYHDTDYAAAGQHAIAALAEYDVVCVHIEAPDEASHQADAMTKVAAIEAIDKHVVGPIHEHLQANEEAYGGYRVLVMPDHYTSVSTRKHDPTPPPFVIAGKHMRSSVERPFSERSAAESDLHIQYGHELMEYFLRSGL